MCEVLATFDWIYQSLQSHICQQYGFRWQLPKMAHNHHHHHQKHSSPSFQFDQIKGPSTPAHFKERRRTEFWQMLQHHHPWPWLFVVIIITIIVVFIIIIVIFIVTNRLLPQWPWWWWPWWFGWNWQKVFKWLWHFYAKSLNKIVHLLPLIAHLLLSSISTSTSVASFWSLWTSASSSATLCSWSPSPSQFVVWLVLFPYQYLYFALFKAGSQGLHEEFAFSGIKEHKARLRVHWMPLSVVAYT